MRSHVFIYIYSYSTLIIYVKKRFDLILMHYMYLDGYTHVY